ncbi:MAG: ATPase, T2SS/T4P/T4SS family [Clostridiales bacterium]
MQKPLDVNTEESNTANLRLGLQKYISSKHANLFAIANKAELKKRMMILIKNYFLENELPLDERLMDSLYLDMAEFGSLTPYLYDNNVEEINLNCWYDVKVTFSDGTIKAIPNPFCSKEETIDLVQRLLRVSGKLVDQSHPLVRTHLGAQKRISAVFGDIMKLGDHICFSIRMVNPKKLKRVEFIENGTATGEILDFLSTLYQYGISMCSAGATGSGKTTLGAYLAATLPYEKRIITIEEGIQEFDLRVKDEEGNVLNNVVHLLTRESDNEAYKVSMNQLVVQTLTLNPYYIIVGEMKTSDGALMILEASNTGHSILTTTHSNSCAGVYDRMVDLCAKNSGYSEERIAHQSVEAFPITFFMKTLDDHSRKVMEVAESYLSENGQRKTRTLYRYVVTDNKRINGKIVVNGYFEKVNQISEVLQDKLRQNGIPQDILNNIIRPKEVKI